MSRYPLRPVTAPAKRRSTYLGPADVRLLDDWGKALRQTFPTAFGAYLVGSAMTRADYRDIDVRIIMPDADHKALGEFLNYRRLNLMLTLWGQRVTGLPIDCQVQSQTLANTKYPMSADDKLHHPRNPLGLRDSDGIEGA